MIDRRNFLKLGALFVPAAIAEPRRACSFLWAPRYVWTPVRDDRARSHIGNVYSYESAELWFDAGQPPRRLVNRTYLSSITLTAPRKS